MLKETGADIGAMPMAEAERRVAEAEALIKMRIEEIASGVARGIVTAVGGGD